MKIFKSSNHPIFKLVIAALFIATLTNCSHWNWVYKNEPLVKEKICQPDTITETITHEYMVPVIKTDTNLLQILNEYETQLLAWEDSTQKLGTNNFELQTSNIKLLKKIRDFKQLATNTKVIERIKLKPYPVYQNKQSTLLKLDKSEALNKTLKGIIWILSFVIITFAAIIAYILKK